MTSQGVQGTLPPNACTVCSVLSFESNGKGYFPPSRAFFLFDKIEVNYFI